MTATRGSAPTTDQHGTTTLGRLRYVVPNAITCASITFGLIAIGTAAEGRPRSAAWWVLYCVLADKLDGAAARALKATSAFGLQLDSLADFLSFGIAPATILYVFFTRHPDLGWGTGVGLWALRAVCAGWVIAAAVRLARFNVLAESPGAERLFFGIATTFAGGTVMALLLAFIKYGDPAWIAGDLPNDFDVRLLGGLRLDGAMRVMPIIAALGALSMVSTLRVPKIGKSKHLIINIWVFGNIALAYSVGLFRVVPEYLAFGGFTYLFGSVYFHITSAAARAVKLPPLFPRDEAAPEPPAAREAGGQGR